jgi:hypothetical protein
MGRFAVQVYQSPSFSTIAVSFIGFYYVSSSNKSALYTCGKKVFLKTSNANFSAILLPASVKL